MSISTSFYPGQRFELSLGPYGSFLSKSFKGLGVRSRFLEPGAVWRLQPLNSPVGWQTYHPHPQFSLDGVNYRLVPGDNTLVEFRPPDSPNILRFTFSEKTILVKDAPAFSQGPEYFSHCGLWLSSDWRTMTEDSILQDLKDAETLGGFSHRLIDYGWSNEDSDMLLDPKQTKFFNVEKIVKEYADANMSTVLWISPWVPYGTHLWDAVSKKGWFTGGLEPEVFPVVGTGEVLGSYLDFTKKDLILHWRLQIENLVKLGVGTSSLFHVF